MNMTDNDFDVVLADKPDDDTIIVTGTQDAIEKKEQEILAASLDKFFKNKDDPQIYSTYTRDPFGADEISIDWLNSITYNINNDINMLLKVNAVIRQRIMLDDIIGRAYEALVANTPSDYSLSYRFYDKNRNKNNKLKRAKEIIERFNDEVDLAGVIRDTVPMTYAEGNRILYLRSKDGHYIIDAIPLGIGLISPYCCNGIPICQVDIGNLKSGLSKIYGRTRKNKPLIFGGITEDILNNYPPEVYDAYAAGEPYANLNPTYCRVIRWNSLGRRYGVSPMLKALKPSIVLDNLEKADVSNSQARGKKIIHQILRKEVLENNKFGLKDMTFAHDQLMSAWRNKNVVYTSPGTVEKIVYVEPSAEDNTADKINSYKSMEMTALGIGFVDTDVSSFSVANISLEQMLKVVNAICDQLSRVIKSYYVVVLAEHGIEAEYAPDVKIIDAEQMDIEMRKSLATALIGTFNSSYKTAYETLGLSYEEELRRRKDENAERIDDVFTPHASQYTSSSSSDGGDGESGRPAESDDTDKQAYDNDRNN